jgi:hypothetical protein
MKTYRILNLGAGVQSTTLALMTNTGEVEPYDYAIFADTQSEPKSVYKHLEWLTGKLSFPVIVRSRGNLRENVINGVNADGHEFMSIPAFTGPKGKSLGVTRRQCTMEYKIRVVETVIKREILCLEKYARVPKDIHISQSMGLSYDEPRRVAKVKARNATARWSAEFPLFDMEMTRADCIKWLKEYGVPHETPRSACTFCPYRSDAEWKDMKDKDPESFLDAVEVDKAIRNKAMRDESGSDLLWIHRSCKPLDQIDFTKSSKDLPGQSFFGFQSECEGMCGV